MCPLIQSLNLMQVSACSFAKHPNSHWALFYLWSVLLKLVGLLRARCYCSEHLGIWFFPRSELQMPGVSWQSQVEGDTPCVCSSNLSLWTSTLVRLQRGKRFCYAHPDILTPRQPQQFSRGEPTGWEVRLAWILLRYVTALTRLLHIRVLGLSFDREAFLEQHLCQTPMSAQLQLLGKREANTPKFFKNN